MESKFHPTRRKYLQSIAGVTGVFGSGLGAQSVAATENIPDHKKTVVSTWTWESASHAQAIEDLLGHDIATVMEFDHWDLARLRGLQQGPGYYQDIIDAGYIPHIVWNGPEAAESDQSWPEGSPAASEYQEGGSRYGQFSQDIIDGVLDEKLRAIGSELSKVDSTVLWAPWEEANGNWRPSIGTMNNGPETWAAAWRHMYEIFQEEGADNLIWIIAPSGNVMRDEGFGDIGSENGVDKWYPGDDYVDYIGTDFYDHGGDFHSEGKPKDIFSELICQFDKVSSEQKPYYQNEIGSHLEDDRADDAIYTPEEWTRDAIRAMRNNDRIIGFLWWDDQDLRLTEDADWGTEPSALTSVGEVVQDEIEHPHFEGNGSALLNRGTTPGSQG